MTFENTPMFFTLLLLPLLAIWQIRQRKKQAISYSSVSFFEKQKKTWRQRLLFVPPLCLHLTLICIITALAEPVIEITSQRQDRQGIAIEILVDVSSSMDISMRFGDKDVTRMEVAKQVVEEFIAGDDDKLSGRPDDLVGIITFARYADTICPMTLGHDAVVHMVRDITINERPNEDGTAYGDATALAAARLKAMEEKSDDDIKSKVIILLTDGENNCGSHLPLQAARMAQEWGIKLYTISIQEKPEIITKKTDKGEFLLPAEPSTSDQLLEKMAEMSNGIFRRAYDFDSLQAVYEEINQLEKTKMKAVNYTDHKPAINGLLISALILLVIKYLLGSTILRVSP
ncbi:MAG: VWA domain-containing protein [Lentisphaeraceae bacterium]|nr:VWA domain-containing protein [Lentisphaeraceae bacterium]